VNLDDSAGGPSAFCIGAPSWKGMVEALFSATLGVCA
jgi:hypothetical protein